MMAAGESLLEASTPVEDVEDMVTSHLASEQAALMPQQNNLPVFADDIQEVNESLED